MLLSVRILTKILVMEKKKLSAHKHQTLLPGWHIPVNPVLVKALGYLEAYVVSQIWYWQQNPQSEGWVDDDGISWVYNSVKKWAEQLGLTQCQTRHVIDKLRKLKVLFSKKLQSKRWVQDLHYRVNVDRVHEIVSQSVNVQELKKTKAAKTRKTKESNAFAKFRKSSCEESQIEVQNTPNDLTNRSSITTPKTTAEEKTPAAAFYLNNDEEKLVRKLIDMGVHDGPGQMQRCCGMVHKFGVERIQRQLKYESLRPKAKNSAARLVAAITNDYGPPAKIVEEQKKADSALKPSEAVIDFIERAATASRVVIDEVKEYFIDKNSVANAFRLLLQSNNGELLVWKNPSIELRESPESPCIGIGVERLIERGAVLV